MIVNTTRITVLSENRRELVQTISSLVDPIRNEKGCLGHRFYQETENENSFLLIGEWETQVDWNNHMKSDNFAVLLGSLSVLANRPDIDFRLLSTVAGIDTDTKLRTFCDKQLD